MSAGKSVADILSGAKDTLSKASVLSDSVSKEIDKNVPKPTPHIDSPKHEYSNAPYSIAREAGNVGKELKTTLAMKQKGYDALK